MRRTAGRFRRRDASGFITERRWGRRREFVLVAPLLALAAFAPQAWAARTAYVTNAGASSVSAFSIATDGSLSEVTGSPFATGTGPLADAVTPNAGHLYVTNASTNNVSAFSIAPDGSLSAVTGSPFAAGTVPSGVAVTPDGSHLYVANAHSDNVSAYSIGADGSLTAVTGSPFTVGSLPAALAVTPDGAHLYVANEGANNVSAFSIAADGSLTAVPGSPFSAGTDPFGVAVTSDGRHVYTANQFSNNVSAFSIASDGSLTAVTGSPFSAGTDPIGIAVTPDGRHVYTANRGSNNVSAFSIATDGSLSAVSGSPFTAATTAIGVAVTPDQGPVARFSVTRAKAGSASSFDGSTSSDPDGTIVRYDWDFGDGSTASTRGAMRKHVYRRPGTYTVTLTVTDDGGCSTARTFTGQTMSCNGGPAARISHVVRIRKPPPPNTKITMAKVNRKKHKATFRFKAIGRANGFQCKLKRAHHRKPRAAFRKCKSPKRYRHLKPGRYNFKVRAKGPGGVDPTPAKRKFRLA